MTTRQIERQAQHTAAAARQTATAARHTAESAGETSDNALEVVRALADAIGPERTALRLSPGLATGGIVEGRDNDELYHYLAVELDPLGLAISTSSMPGAMTCWRTCGSCIAGRSSSIAQAARASRSARMWRQGAPTWKR